MPILLTVLFLSIYTFPSKASFEKPFLWIGHCQWYWKINLKEQLSSQAQLLNNHPSFRHVMMMTELSKHWPRDGMHVYWWYVIKSFHLTKFSKSHQNIIAFSFINENENIYKFHLWCAVWLLCFSLTKEQNRNLTFRCWCNCPNLPIKIVGCTKTAVVLSPYTLCRC